MDPNELANIDAIVKEGILGQGPQARYGKVVPVVESGGALKS